MADMRVTRWLAMATAAILVLTANPASASISWSSPPCATGAITGHSLQLGDEAGPFRSRHIRLDGWSALCTTPDRQYQFGVILYSGDQARIGRLTTYQEHGPTTFAYIIEHLSIDTGPPTAICIASGRADRMSCVSVTNQTDTAPIDVTDARVLPWPLGGCGNCVTDP